MADFALYQSATPAQSLQLLHAIESIAKKNGLETLDGGFIPPNAKYEDYVHPDRGPALFLTNIILASVTLCFVLARLWTRVKIAGGLGADDCMIVVSMIVVIGSTVLQCYGVKFGGFGRHYYDVTVDEMTMLLKITYAMPIIYSAGITLIKISVLLFYKRLFPSNARMQKVCNWFMIFQALFAVGACIGFALICTPVKGWWHLELRADTCPTFVNTMRVYVGLRVVTVICDIIVVCLPMHMLWNLRIPAKQKLGLATLFGLGILACGVAIARLALLPRLLLHLDVGWNIVPIGILDHIEQCVGIIVASIPALAAIVQRRKHDRKSTQAMSQHLYTHSKSSANSRSTGSVPASLEYNKPPLSRHDHLESGNDGGPPQEQFDFLSFAYDPERHSPTDVSRTFACAYSGDQKRPVPPGMRESFVTAQARREEAAVLRTHPVDTIAATTTVTVVTTRARGAMD